MKLFKAVILACALSLGSVAPASAEQCALADKAATVQRAVMALNKATTPAEVDAIKKEVVKYASDLPAAASLGEGELATFFDDITKAMEAKDDAKMRKVTLELYREFLPETVCAAAK
ncbi:MAG: hypothetical protein KBE09_02105 [Candidatus Pacebacteria bacterium]|nr:hypothetical protein [Candidatus Paceibacterota bacterium]